MRWLPVSLFVMAALAVCLAGGCAKDKTIVEDPECGDGVQEGTEQCDGNDLGTGTCPALGFETGILTCDDNCLFDASHCEDIARDCGNGALDGNEACDDANLTNGDGCDFNCNVEAGFECAGEPSVCTGGDTCGNGILDGDELCELGDLDGQTCLTLGYDGGMLSCLTDCTFNTSQCSGGPCGNGSLDLGEQCDGANLDSETCVTQGYLHGALACATDCTFDTTACSNDPCGNGTVDTGEQCDGANLNAETCVTRGFLAGTLSCLPNCIFDDSACANHLCGNGTVEAPEQCDDGNTQPNDGCSATCQWEGQCTPDYALTCGTGVSGALLLSTDAITNYSCGTASAVLGDHVYSFVAGGTGLANASLDVVEEDPLFADEIDLYVLEGACAPSQCIAAGNNVGDELFTFPVQAGLTYYVIVETVAWGLLSQLDYNLTVACP